MSECLWARNEFGRSYWQEINFEVVMSMK